MDPIEMLGNQTPATPSSIDLTGLSPEEIRGVSTSRVSREQTAMQMADFISKQQQAAAASEMTTIKDATGKEYQIPRKNIVEGINAMANVNRYNLSKEQAEAVDKIVPMEIEGKTYNISTGHRAAIAGSIREGKEAEQKALDVKSLEGLSMEQLTSDEHLSVFARTYPNAFTAWVNRRVPEGAAGLSDAQYRYYADLNVNLIDNVLAKSSPDDALINTANNLSRKLKDSHMLLKIDKIFGTKAVTVSLPPGMTADMVYELAEADRVNVSDIIQEYYDKSQE